MVTVGPSIRNFFEDIIMCMLLMLISVVIFAIYAFVSNIVASSICRHIQTRTQRTAQPETCVVSP